jgi:alkylhydroperoxidase/carboxymuconolactone decarboxylase family protein YurZ
MGIAVAVRCDDCIGFHVKATLDRGASQDEMAIYMGAGPSVMYASHALEAFGQGNIKMASLQSRCLTRTTCLDQEEL